MLDFKQKASVSRVCFPRPCLHDYFTPTALAVGCGLRISARKHAPPTRSCCSIFLCLRLFCSVASPAARSGCAMPFRFRLPLVWAPLATRRLSGYVYIALPVYSPGVACQHSYMLCLCLPTRLACIGYSSGVFSHSHPILPHFSAIHPQL